MPATESRAERSAFAKVRNAEAAYARVLRQVARQIGVILRPFVDLGAEEPLPPLAAGMVAVQLERYADLLSPWAEAVGQRMLADVQRRDAGAWHRHARRMGRALQIEIQRAPIGEVMRAALARQVDLITSLPREAAQRVHNLALTGLVTGRRAGEIRGTPEKAPLGLARDILETGHVTVSRANLIARTETGRVSTELTKARASFVGSNSLSLDGDHGCRHTKAAPTIAW